MSSATPPNPFFSDINFNPSFFSSINDFLTEAVANSKYLKLIGGVLTGFLGIKRTPRVELDVNGKAIINDATNGVPANGILGSTGTKLILTEGTVSDTPYAIGTGTGNLWYGTGATGEHRFYTGINQRMVISSTGSVGISTTAPQTVLDVRGATNIQLATSALPGIGTYGGGGGNRLILFPGSATLYPFSLGYNIDTLWYGAATTGRHEFYSGNKRTFFISDTGVQTGNTMTINGADNISLQLTLTSSLTTDDCAMKFGAPGGIQMFIGLAGSASPNVLTRSNAYFISSGSMIFMTNNRTTASNFMITTAGNVGINTDNPSSSRLYVVGDSRVDGNFLLGSASPMLQFTPTFQNTIGVAGSAGSMSASAATGDMVIRSASKLLLQSGSGNSAITINTNNYVNIGTGVTTGSFPVTVNSTSSANQSMTFYAIAATSAYNGAQSTAINPSISFGILCQTAFSTGFYIYSDERIKKDITPLESTLDLFDKINTVSFKYIDYIGKGSLKNYGVIAQEIEKIIPEVINSHKDYIPNIYKNADKYDSEYLRLYIKSDILSIGDNIKIYDFNNKEHIKKIVDKTDEYITINEPIEDYEEDTSVFIYGKEIEDVKNVNYESLFIMNIKATQELHQRLKTLEDIIKNLINR